MKNLDPALQIMVAVDAFDQQDYTRGAELLKSLPKVIVRTRDAGVHYGHLAFIANAQHGTYRVVLTECRRIWSWVGANTLNEIAMRGPVSGKISEPTVNIIPQVIEVIPCSTVSEQKLNSLKW